MTAFQMARPAVTCLLLLGLTTASCRTLGAEPVSQEAATPAALDKYLADEIAKWKPVIEAAGVYAD